MPTILEDEVQSEKVYNGPVEALCTNDQLYKLAVAGDGKLRFYNLQNWQECKGELIDLPTGYGRVARLQWSSNGQVIVVSMEKGLIVGYQTSVPTLTAVCSMFLALQTSFTEVQIMETSKLQLLHITTIKMENEPNSIVLGRQFFAAALNNNIFYY